MKKSFKFISALVFVAVLSAGTVFARNGKNFNNRGRNDSPARQDFGQGCCTPGGGFGNLSDEQTVLGKIKSVDEKNSLVTVVNADGKDEVFSVTPFTRICFRPENDGRGAGPRRNSDNTPKFGSFSDLKKDQWVSVRVVKTDTATKVAGRILLAGE